MHAGGWRGSIDAPMGSAGEKRGGKEGCIGGVEMECRGAKRGAGVHRGSKEKRRGNKEQQSGSLCLLKS